MKKLRNNSNTKKLGIELGLLPGMKQFNGDVINFERMRRWVISGYEYILDDKELRFVKQMRWL